MLEAQKADGLAGEVKFGFNTIRSFYRDGRIQGAWLSMVGRGHVLGGRATGEGDQSGQNTQLKTY